MAHYRSYSIKDTNGAAVEKENLQKNISVKSRKRLSAEIVGGTADSGQDQDPKDNAASTQICLLPHKKESVRRTKK